MTSIEYKNGMVKALKDLSGELGNDFGVMKVTAKTEYRQKKQDFFMLVRAK